MGKSNSGFSRITILSNEITGIPGKAKSSSSLCALLANTDHFVDVNKMIGSRFPGCLKQLRY